jgi:YidC/Oxa1 family membrane protein insertase
MEKRLILAIVLSFAILVGYQLLIVKPQQQQKAQAAAPAVTPAEPLAAKPLAAPASVGTAAPKASPSSEAPAPEAVAANAEGAVRITTPLYEAVWSNKGAVLTSWKLKKFKARLPKKSSDPVELLEMVNRQSAELGRYPFGLVLDDDAALAERLNGALFQASGAALDLRDGETGELRFVYSDGSGVRAEKSLKFKGGTYEVGLDIRVWKNGQETAPRILWGPGIGNPSPEEMKQRFSSSTGLAALGGGRVYRMDERKYKPEASAISLLDWAAYEENYFAAIFFFPPQQGSASFLKETRDATSVYYVSASRPESAFLGPKDFDILKGLGRDARKIINFGFFGAIAEVLLVAMKTFHRLIPNWGVSIIILTIVIKILFFPLTYHSTKSMAKMAELQPKVKALRAKYKKSKTDIDQRRQMNEEMMRLYKEHGVNPAGGCLPMLIQLPVFWGVFRMLVVAVEFRHSPFAFWLTDLSVRDPFYVTPLLMGATQFIQQKMTPSAADPSQARMMLIMPVVMTVFFLNFQSGLVLYWLVSNLLQIGQQAIMNRMMARKKSENHGKRKKSD